MVVDVIPLQHYHWEAVRDIYLDGLATGQASFETRAPDWEEWNGAHLARPRLVAVRDGAVVGWIALCPVSKRRCYAGVAEVSIYVANAARGQGVGKVLLAHAIRESESAGIWTLQAVIYPENAVSVRLHQGCGFRVVGHRERIAQRDGLWRDTVLLERRSEIAGL